MEGEPAQHGLHPVEINCQYVWGEKRLTTNVKRGQKGGGGEEKMAMMREGEPAQKNAASRPLTQYTFLGKPAYL